MNKSYSFPFGQPISAVKQVNDGIPKKLFILGVYASAVHVKWFGPDGKIRIKAMAVASEPEIFWNGENADVLSVIDRINLDARYGYLAPADNVFNGPSGRCLDKNYLEPLKLTRQDVWLCDLLPESRKNPSQTVALSKKYDGFVDIPYDFPPVPSLIADEKRVLEIVKELETSGAKRIVLLGDEPTKYFLNHFDTSIKRLSKIEPYGKEIPVMINGNDYAVVCLAHPRQTAKLGKSNQYWYDKHQRWMSEI